MVAAAEADTGHTIPSLRVDGGMSANPTFVQALANATGKAVEVSPVAEATTLGAAFLAGVATGVVAAVVAPRGMPFGAAAPSEPGPGVDVARAVPPPGAALVRMLPTGPTAWAARSPSTPGSGS